MRKLILLLLITLQTFSFAQGCWKQVSNGQNHTIALKTDGTLWAWGQNFNGSLGNGSTNNSSIPIQIGTDNDWDKIAAGAGHSLALKSDGSLWAWGYNSNGQVGNNTTTNVVMPTRIGTDTDWKDIYGGIYSSAAIKNDSSLWGWGSNSYSELGIQPITDNVFVPTQIGTDMDWKAISFGGAFALGLKNNGTLWSWGTNIFGYGELGNGLQNSQVFTPTQIGIATNWKEISASISYSMAIKTNGTLWSWGANYGYSPIQNGLSSNWMKIKTYNGSSLAIKIDGTLWSWGGNSKGQLGNGTTTNNNIPTQLGVQNNWTQLSKGMNFSSVLNSNFELKTFGENNYGQLGDGTTVNSSTPIDVSCTVLGIDEFATNQMIQLYPNPVNDYLNINKVAVIEITSVEIIDCLGKTVLKNSGEESRINISHLSSGLYLVKITTNNQKIVTNKILKQ